jgi:hypothetical protein
MRLVRYGERGQERPGVLDSQGLLRDLSGVVRDIDGAALMPDRLDRLRALDPGSVSPPASAPRASCPTSAPPNSRLGRLARRSERPDAERCSIVTGTTNKESANVGG